MESGDVNGEAELAIAHGERASGIETTLMDVVPLNESLPVDFSGYCVHSARPPSVLIEIVNGHNY
ncbi:hypothetical protein StoSoilB13_35340 (plasmid) [Arthrobacter sp. StoSoilB13]|nr:hypothetical protein StoSoilB13_35340 [Arthrobacter sp. StoSoilB13]